MIIAGTGHRPDKLGGYGTNVYNSLINVAKNYLEKNNVTHVISGMALGWDQALADAALELTIPYTAAIPFEGQDKVWPEKSRIKYKNLLMYAQNIEIICPGSYSNWKMQARNEWMVDNCDTLLALWDGSSGGTGNCIKYALSVEKSIDNLWKDYVANYKV